MKKKVWQQTVDKHNILIFFGFLTFVLCFLCFPKKVYAADYYISSIDDLKAHCENGNTETLILTQDLGLGSQREDNGHDKVITVNGNKTIIGNGHQIANYKTKAYANSNAKSGGNPIFGVNTGAILTTRSLTINGNRYGCKCSDNSTIVVYNATFNAEDGTVICQGVGNGIQAFNDSHVNVRGNVSIYNNYGSGIGSWGAISVDGADIWGNGAGIHARGQTSRGEFADIGGNTRIHDNNDVGIYVTSGETLRFNNGQVFHNKNTGIVVDGECIFSDGAVYENQGDGISTGAGFGVDGGRGTLRLKGGVIRNNSNSGVLNKGIFEFSNGQICGNGSAGVYQCFYLADFKMNGFDSCIHSNGRAGVDTQAGSVALSNGNIYNNHTGVNDLGGALHISDYVKINGNYDQNLYISSGVTAEMTGGEICNGTGDNNVSNNGTFLLKGGSIHDKKNGISNGGTLNMSGGWIYACSSAGIRHTGSTTITGGSFSWNGHDVEHFGSDAPMINRGSLVIDSGANGGNRMSVWLSSSNNYIANHGSHDFNISMPSNAYVRGKVLVRSDSPWNAKNTYNQMGINKCNNLEKRYVSGNDVVLWDKYQQKIHYYKKQNGNWVNFSSDKNIEKWYGDKYKPDRGGAPMGYEWYATTTTKPTSSSEPSKGYDIGEITVTGQADIYVCYYPKTYRIYFDGNTGVNPVPYSIASDFSVNPTSIKVVYDCPIPTLPVPTLVGDEFQGWYNTREYGGSQVIAGAIYQYPGDTTLYAHWKDITTPTLEAYKTYGWYDKAFFEKEDETTDPSNLGNWNDDTNQFETKNPDVIQQYPSKEFEFKASDIGGSDIVSFTIEGDGIKAQSFTVDHPGNGIVNASLKVTFDGNAFATNPVHTYILKVKDGAGLETPKQITVKVQDIIWQASLSKSNGDTVFDIDNPVCAFNDVNATLNNIGNAFPFTTDNVKNISAPIVYMEYGNMTGYLFTNIDAGNVTSVDYTFDEPMMIDGALQTNVTHSLSGTTDQLVFTIPDSVMQNAQPENNRQYKVDVTVHRNVGQNQYEKGPDGTYTMKYQTHEETQTQTLYFTTNRYPADENQMHSRIRYQAGESDN